MARDESVTRGGLRWGPEALRVMSKRGRRARAAASVDVVVNVGWQSPSEPPTVTPPAPGPLAGRAGGASPGPSSGGGSVGIGSVTSQARGWPGSLPPWLLAGGSRVAAPGPGAEASEPEGAASLYKVGPKSSTPWALEEGSGKVAPGLGPCDGKSLLRTRLEARGPWSASADGCVEASPSVALCPPTLRGPAGAAHVVVSGRRLSSAASSRSGRCGVRNPPARRSACSRPR